MNDLKSSCPTPLQVEKVGLWRIRRLWRTLPPTAPTPFQLERETYGAHFPRTESQRTLSALSALSALNAHTFYVRNRTRLLAQRPPTPHGFRSAFRPRLPTPPN
jgi:hypothetical protein